MERSGNIIYKSVSKVNKGFNSRGGRNKSLLTRPFDSAPKTTTHTHTLENSDKIPKRKRQNLDQVTTLGRRNQIEGRYLLMQVGKIFNQVH